MKIKIGHPKIKTDNNFSENDKKFIKLLETDESLEKTLNSLRKSVRIPLEGINLNSKKSIKNIPTTDESLSRLWKAARGLLWYYNLPPRWENTAVSIILFNVATPPDKDIHSSVTFSSTKNKFNITDFSRFDISLWQKIPLETLIQILRAKKREYDKFVSSLPENQTVNKIKNRNILLSSYIRDVETENPNLNDEGISIEIEKQHGYTRSADSITIRQTRSRMKNYRKKHILNYKFR